MGIGSVVPDCRDKGNGENNMGEVEEGKVLGRGMADKRKGCNVYGFQHNKPSDTKHNIPIQEVKEPASDPEIVEVENCMEAYKGEYQSPKPSVYDVDPVMGIVKEVPV